MTQKLESLNDIAGGYDAIVLDQWGVLHNGTTPYNGTMQALQKLVENGHRLAVLSNSGKRSAPNAARIEAIGFAPHLFEMVLTSGEALWQDIKGSKISQRSLFVIERMEGDAADWATGLDIELTRDLSKADSILFMGLPDGAMLEDFLQLLNDARARNLPAFCSNPDRASPRAGGTVISPGALAFAYQDMGGDVTFYGKPHRPVFDAMKNLLQCERPLMVGDSLEHDIAGAVTAGWDSVLIQGGLYADDFAQGNEADTLEKLVLQKGGFRPTYRMDLLK